MISQLYYTILYEPIFNALIGIYHILPWKDFGIAIILVTLAIKIILYFPSLSSIKSQRALQEIQPKLDAIREKYKGEKEKMSQELMKFYKENKVNPFSSCLPLLIQFPILIALYRVFMGGLRLDPATGILVPDQLQYLYDGLRSIYDHTALSTMFLGFIDMSHSKNIPLAVLAAGFQFWQARMLEKRKPKVKTEGAKDEALAANINRQMMYLFPIMTLYFGYVFPAGLTLYWLVSTLFTIAQQYYIFKKHPVKTDAAAPVPHVQ